MYDTKPISLSNIIFALLFINSEPLTINSLKAKINLFALSNDDILDAIKEIKQKLEDTPFKLIQTDDALKITLKNEYNTYISPILNSKPSKLSDSALETLAIIVHRQPVSKQEIEQIRQVDCEKVLYTLLKANLVRQIGNLKAQGSPILYTITDECLFRFGFKNYNELLSFINSYIIK